MKKYTNSGQFKKGHRQSEESRLKMSLARKGVEPSNKGIPMSEETRKKVSKSRKGKKGGIPFPKGSIPWNKGKGTKTTEAQRLRVSKEYKLWRESVFKKDNYTCVWCKKTGGNLNADHIKPFAYFPELRFAIDNGRTLCVDCHRTTDNFGGRGRKNSATSKWRCIAVS